MQRAAMAAARAIVTLGVDMATEFPKLLLEHGTGLLMLFVAGTALVVARQAFFVVVLPSIRAHATIAAFLVNAFRAFAMVAAAAFELVWDGFADVVNVVSLLGGDAVHVRQTDVRFHDVLEHPISADAVVSAVRYYEDVCASYDSVYTVGGNALKLYVSSPACNVARFMYPVAWLRPVLGVLSPLYTGGADPNKGNCQGAANHYAAPSITCCVLGAGYVLLEALLPLAVFVLLLIAAGRPLLRLGWQITRVLGEAVGRGIVLLYEVLDRLEV